MPGKKGSPDKKRHKKGGPPGLNDELPVEVIDNIMSFLKGPSVIQAAKVCKLWRALLKRSNQLDEAHVERAAEVMRQYRSLTMGVFRQDSLKLEMAAKLLKGYELDRRRKGLILGKIRDLQQINMELTKGYNQLKKKVPNRLWNKQIGKDLMEGNKWLIVMIRHAKAAGVRV